MSPFDREPDFLLTFYSNYGSITCRFWDIQCRKILWPWNPSQGSLKVIDSLPPKNGYSFLLLFYSNFVDKMHRFWDTRLVSIQWPWNPGWGSFKVIESDTSRSAAYDFLLTFYGNHWPISYRFRDKRRFQSKIANFSQLSVYFAPPLKGFSMELGVGAGSQKKLEW